MLRFVLLLLALIGLAAPAHADDISAASRGVVRVVVIAFEDGQIVDFGHGSGFAVAPNKIVTNAHVVALANDYPDNVAIGVVPSEGAKSYGARLVAFDSRKDLALLEMQEGAIPPVPLYMGALADGMDVVSLGYPGNVDLATAQSMEDYIIPAAPTRSEGNFSNERRIAGVNALLHTASIARGNSGGPLLDECGRVIGVNAIITRQEEGDAPFGFAIANRELAPFLRAAGQPFTAISSECVSMAQRLRDERYRLDQEQDRARQEALAAARDRQEALAAARADIEYQRENRTAIALLLGVLGVAGLGIGGLMLARDRQRPAWIAGGLGLLLIAGGAAAFFTRPSRADIALPDAPAAEKAQASFIGPNICRFLPDRSRVTVSSVEPVQLDWTETGCVNGRTQYAQHGEGWSRILVPADEATISVAEFDPATGRYIVDRYLMSAADMAKARELRSQIEVKECAADEEALALLADRQEMIRSSLPDVPNERLVYQCGAAGGGS
jgi:V8-like Glu-specific endopeptidase